MDGKYDLLMLQQPPIVLVKNLCIWNKILFTNAWNTGYNIGIYIFYRLYVSILYIAQTHRKIHTRVHRRGEAMRKKAETCWPGVCSGCMYGMTSVMTQPPEASRDLRCNSLYISWQIQRECQEPSAVQTVKHTQPRKQTLVSNKKKELIYIHDEAINQNQRTWRLRDRFETIMHYYGIYTYIKIIFISTDHQKVKQGHSRQINYFNS